MSQKLVLNVEPFSINRLHYRDGKIKTQTARDWECRVFHELSKEPNSKILKELRDKFDHLKHGYIIKMVCFYAQEKLFNRQGAISAKSMDISNWEKPLIDLIFLEKFSELKPPFGAENLKTDDRFILQMSSGKRASKTPRIEVSLRIVDLDRYRL